MRPGTKVAGIKVKRYRVRDITVNARGLWQEGGDPWDLKRFPLGTFQPERQGKEPCMTTSKKTKRGGRGVLPSGET